MSLTNYTNLQTAIQQEADRSEATWVTYIPDMIKRAEAKMNRRLRLRNMETQATASYTSSNTTRRVKVPTDLLEMLDIQIKKTSQADTEYYTLKQVPPYNLPKYYGSEVCVYAWRKDIELNNTVSEAHTIKMHYYQMLDIATDSTNWVLTNFPDIYLYGSLAETELYWKDDRVVVWKSLFDEAIIEANMLDERSRNDSELENPMVGFGRSSYNILRDQ